MVGETVIPAPSRFFGGGSLSAPSFFFCARFAVNLGVVSALRGVLTAIDEWVILVTSLGFRMPADGWLSIL